MTLIDEMPVLDLVEIDLLPTFKPTPKMQWDSNTWAKLETSPIHAELASTGQIPKWTRDRKLDPELRAFFVRAMTNLATYGWCKGMMIAPGTGRVCAVGAMLLAVPGVERHGSDSGWRLLDTTTAPVHPNVLSALAGTVEAQTAVLSRNPIVYEAADYMLRHIEPNPLTAVRKLCRIDPASGVTLWNDNHPRQEEGVRELFLEIINS